MSHLPRTALCLLLPAVSLSCQTVLTVGVGGQFADLPAAVAAAQPGDTVRCLQFPPFSQFTAPTITTGITLDGGGSHRLVGQLVIDSVPAGQICTVQEFQDVTPFSVLVRDCAGRVHLDSLWTTTGATSISALPSIEIERCSAVTLHDVRTHGSPAVSVTDSTAILNACRLGVSAGGTLGQGRCVEGLRSSITITRPDFRVGPIPQSAIEGIECIFVIAGVGGIYGGDSPLFAQSPAIVGTNSGLTISPNVTTTGAVQGFASPTVEESPYHRTVTTAGTAVLDSFGPPFAFGAAILSPLNLPTPSPLGNLWIDPVGAPSYTFQLDFSGRHFLNVPIPPQLPVGTAFTVQGAVLTPSSIELLLPSTFLIRN